MRYKPYMILGSLQAHASKAMVEGGGLEPKIVETKYMCMKESKNDIFGISESFNHALEWRSKGADSMVRRNVCPTLRATDYKCPKYVWYKSNEQIMEEQKQIELPEELKGRKFRIRKLTPKECFRLMGVDDKDIDKMQAYPYETLIEHPAYSKEERFRGMTDKEKRAAMKRSISESAQYKLAGNSIVVDVLFHLFRKMFIETDYDKTDKPQQLTLF